MTNNKQLGQEQRYVIDRLFRQGKSQKEITDVVGYHKATINRELKRNSPKRGRGAKEYNPQRAHMKTERRQREKNKHITFTVDMRRQIVKTISCGEIESRIDCGKWP